MITIHYSHDGKTHHLHITGHAGYASAGSDIVCAGVSALSLALLGYTRELDAVEEEHCRPGELKLRCDGYDETDIAFAMVLAGYEIIAKTYPRYVEVDRTPSEKGEEKEYRANVQHQHRDGL